MTFFSLLHNTVQHTTNTSILDLPQLVELVGLLRLRDTRVRAVRNVLGNVYLISLTKNLWYKERLDSGGGGAVRCHKVQGIMEA